jgi:hypothetical protein
MQKWTTFLWSELKQLFTYSPIHLFTFLEKYLKKVVFQVFSRYIPDFDLKLSRLCILVT